MTPEITNALLGFVSGLMLAFVGAYLATFFERRRERRAKVEEARFSIYMKLLDLHAQYFWLASAEMRNQEPPEGVRSKVHAIAWQIADQLRAADEANHLDEILEVLFCEPAYETAIKRNQALKAVIDKLGREINPRFAESIRKISERNMTAVDRTPLTNARKLNAPGSSM